MPRLPQPTATRMPGLIRLATFDPSHAARTAAGTSARVGCGAVWRTSWTCGRFTAGPRAVGVSRIIIAEFGGRGKRQRHSPQRHKGHTEGHKDDVGPSSFLCVFV